MAEPTGAENTPISFSQPVISDDAIDLVAEALESGWLTTGPRTEAFESKLGDLCEVEHALGTTNCTSALYLALRALDIDGEVVTTPMTFATTVSSCRIAGTTPVLADVRPDTLTLDPECVKEAITPETEAILPVHYAGQATDMDAILDIAADNDLAIIEDTAHGLGGQYEGTPQGTLGDVGCFSFYATKTITTGEGGAFVTDDDDVAERARTLRLAGVDKDAWARQSESDHGWAYDVVDTSMKFNMNDIQASIGLSQIERVSEFVEKRRRLADRYDSQFESVKEINTLGVRDPEEHARHLYPVFVDTTTADLSRKELSRALEERDIGTSVHYIPIHYHSAFEDVRHGGLPVTEKRYEQLLCLPLHPKMDEESVDHVVQTVDELL
jgi:dTDP-4-amino-4,6-dideoxygalactose transaminase